MDDARKVSLSCFDDEQARREEMKHLQAQRQEMQLNEDIRKVKASKEKVSEMRHQDSLRLQMDQLNKSGNTKKAVEIATRLDVSKDSSGHSLTPRSMAMEKIQPNG